MSQLASSPEEGGLRPKIPLTGMGFQEVSSDSGTQGSGQECGLGVPEGLAKCLLSLVDLG